MRRLAYVLLTVGLVSLIALCGVRIVKGRWDGLPAVDAPPDIAGRSCGDALRTARALSKSGALDRAREAYLWVAGHCEDPRLLPVALLEAGSLLGHLMRRPDDARRVYADFLRRFPDDPGAADATYHLAKLDLDAGDYRAAVSHLTALTERYPDSTHAASAAFLAARAAEQLAADRRERRTVAGRLSAFVPNNILSLLALLAAVGPSAIQVVRQTGTPTGSRRRWPIPAAIIALTLLNWIINNLDNARRTQVVLERIEQLEAGLPVAGPR